MLAADPGYGSDRNGMIWGYRFVPDRPAESVDESTIMQYLAVSPPKPLDDFLWLHFSLSNAASESWLRQHLNLPDVFFDSLHNAGNSTRLEQDGEMLVAVINDVPYAFSFDVSAVETTCLCLSQNLLISARLRPLRSIDRLRGLVRQGHTYRSPVELLAHLLQNQAAVLGDILRQATSRVDAIEDQLLTNRILARRSELGSLRRVLVRLQRLLAPEPAAFFRLINRPQEWITREDIQDLQESAEEIAAAVGDTVSLIERVKLIQEELVAVLSEQTSRSLFLLTMVTVLALPINLTAGLFGMNVGGIPLALAGYGFTAIASLSLLITAVLAYLAFGRGRG